MLVDDDMDLGRKYDLMLGILEEAIGYFPKFATAYRRRGELLVAKLDDKAAVPEFTKAIRLNPRDAHAYSERGLAQWRWGDGNSAAALRDFDEAIRLEPENCHFLHYRGQIRRNARDFKGARADFDEAIRLCPGDPGNYYERALVLNRLGRRAEAIRDLEMYLDRDHTHGYRDHDEEQHAQTLRRDLKHASSVGLPFSGSRIHKLVTFLARCTFPRRHIEFCRPALAALGGLQWQWDGWLGSWLDSSRVGSPDK